ncbi:ABC transporter ATP-binding protein [Kushneria aurantia]|uniref:ABC transporter ATP-binding protein n=1 Tax=Kushneria aurantia TaxID=504092 RepID=A0ABV6G0I3_9GAMM|nr:ABC transporter ATP-binding protein [Kushneria aurantia]
MTDLNLSHVSKGFGGTLAVEDFCLEAEPGEFIVLVGPSGCGKTTTMRMIAGLEDVTAGTIALGDLDITEVPARDRDVAMVFQNYALYPHMSVLDNIAFSLKMRGVSRDAREHQARDVAELLGISHLLGRKPRELSGGQRQRVALGRAIVRQPKLFLMDEPLSNLDAKLRVAMRAEIVKLQRQLGITTVYVTHDQVEAMTMGHRIVVMKDGVVQQIGTPEQIYDRPANRFVAEFIGTPPMNFASGEWAAEHDELRLWGEPVPLESARAARLRADVASGPIELGFRPEHVHLCSSSSPSTTSAIEVPVHIELIENVGNSRIVETVTPSGGALNAICASDFRGAVGDRLQLRVDVQHLHVFNQQHARVS